MNEYTCTCTCTNVIDIIKLYYSTVYTCTASRFPKCFSKTCSISFNDRAMSGPLQPEKRGIGLLVPLE